MNNGNTNTGSMLPSLILSFLRQVRLDLSLDVTTTAAVTHDGSIPQATSDSKAHYLTALMKSRVVTSRYFLTGIGQA